MACLPSLMYRSGYAPPIAEGHYPPGGAARVSEDETDAGIQFAGMPFHLGHHESFLARVPGLIAEAGVDLINRAYRAVLARIRRLDWILHFWNTGSLRRSGRSGESLGERDGGAVAFAVRVVIIARLVAVTGEAQIIHREGHRALGIGDIAAVDGALALAAGDAGAAAGDAAAPGAADHGIGKQAFGVVMDEDG